MEKIAKVIHELELCLDDAVAAVVPRDTVVAAIELLKVQEPVSVKWFTFRDDITDEEYQIPFCGACERNVTDAIYCPNCGRPVKW